MIGTSVKKEYEVIIQIVSNVEKIRYAPRIESIMNNETKTYEPLRVS